MIGTNGLEGEDLHSGPWHFGINREAAGVAFHLDVDLFVKSRLVEMVQLTGYGITRSQIVMTSTKS